MKLLNNLFRTRASAAKCLSVLIMLIPFATQAFESEQSQSFSDVESIKVNTISGNLTLVSSNSGEIEVTVFSTYSDNKMEMVMEQHGMVLILKEKSHGNGSFSGHSKWTVAVPDSLETTIKFNTASGDFESTDVSATLDVNTASGDINLSNFSGKVSANTASGNIKLVNVKGQLIFNTASGNVDAESVEGDMKLNTASGDVNANSINITGSSDFNSASGDVEVSLNQSPMHDLKISSASGDVELDMQGNSLQGQVSLTTKNKSRYQINAPFEFDNSEVTSRYGQEYITKSATLGDASISIMLETSSGNASIKE